MRAEGKPLRPTRNTVQRAIIFFIFYFFKLSVDVVIFRVVCRNVAGANLLLHVAVSDFHHQFLGNLRQFLHFRFDRRHIFAFQGGSSALSADSIAVCHQPAVYRLLLRLLTGAVQQMVATVTGLNQLFGLRLDSVSLLHREPFSVSSFQTRRRLDGDLLLSFAIFVFSRGDCGIPSASISKGDFDHRGIPRGAGLMPSRLNGQRFVIRRTFTLSPCTAHGWLPQTGLYFRSREHTAVLGRDNWCFGDKRSHHATHRFDTRTAGVTSSSEVTSFTSPVNTPPVPAGAGPATTSSG